MDQCNMNGVPGYDPDLESRLYAEIHYSNDTYPDHMAMDNGYPHRSINPIPNIMDHYSALPPRYHPHHSAQQPVSHHNSWPIDTMPGCDPRNPSMYSRNHQGIGPPSNYNNLPHQQPAMNYPTNNEMYSKRSRPLLDNVYPSRIPQHYNYPNHPNQSMPIQQMFDDYQNQRNRFPSRTTQPSRMNNINITNSRRPPRNPSRNSRMQGKVVNENNSASTAKRKTGKNDAQSYNNKSTNSRKPNETAKSSKSTSNLDTLDDRAPGTYEDTTSKYDVAGKSKQPQEINPSKPNNTLEVQSDSDESICEVPVPPKPKPLLINLQDSDEASSSNEDDNEQSPVVMDGESQILPQQPPPLPPPPQPVVDENTNSSSTIIPAVISSSESTQDSQNEPGNLLPLNTNNEESSNDTVITSSNIIINCTQVTTGVTTLADIKRIRESINASSNNDGLSDDSMTESEAMKWRQIEGQIDGNKDDKVTDTAWNQNSAVSADKTTVAEPSTEPMEITGEIVDQVAPSSSTVQTSAKRKRSRFSDAGPEDTEKQSTSEQAVDQNKTKKSTKDMSFEESIFQPRPKSMEAFYNEPRGSMMMMDVHKIQSRMPSNPKCWAILDADKSYNVNVRDKRKKCSLCHRSGHTRDKCPNHRHVPTCHMCGETGHYEPRCPHSMCLTCGTKFSSYRKTCEKCRNTHCNICKSQGHTEDKCPDLWRRYHQTTTGTSVIVPTNPSKILKSPNNLSCCNCTKNGHHSSNCKKYRWSQHFILPRYVTSYTRGLSYTPDNTLNEDDDADITIDLVDDSMNNSIEVPAELPTNAQTVLRSIYKYVNVPEDEMESWPSTVINLDLFKPRNHIVSWEKYFYEPTFFKTQFPPEINCQFGIMINQMSDKKKYEIILKSATQDSLYILERLMIQWLNRRTVDDQSVMNTARALPYTKLTLLTKLIRALCRFYCPKSNTSKSLRCANSFLQVEKELESKSITPKRKEILLTRIQKDKYSLLRTAYNHGLIPDAKRILMEFLTFLNNLANLPIGENDPVPSEMYMCAIWFNFELFSPCISNKVITTVQKCFNRMSQIKSKKKVGAMPKPSLLHIITKDTLNELMTKIPCVPKIISNDNSEIENNDLVILTDAHQELGSTEINVIQTNDEINKKQNDSKMGKKKKSETTKSKNKKKVKETGKKNKQPKQCGKGKQSVELKMPINLPKPLAKRLINNTQILKYAYAASIYARENDMKVMIPRMDHLVDRAKLGLVDKEEIISLWKKMKIATKMYTGEFSSKKMRRQNQQLNPNT